MSYYLNPALRKIFLQLAALMMLMLIRSLTSKGHMRVHMIMFVNSGSLRMTRCVNILHRHSMCPHHLSQHWGHLPTVISGVSWLKARHTSLGSWGRYCTISASLSSFSFESENSGQWESYTWPKIWHYSSKSFPSKFLPKSVWIWRGRPKDAIFTGATSPLMIWTNIKPLMISA